MRKHVHDRRRQVRGHAYWIWFKALRISGKKVKTGRENLRVTDFVYFGQIFDSD